MTRRILTNLMRLLDALPAETGHVHAGAVGAATVCHDPECRIGRRA